MDPMPEGSDPTAGTAIARMSDQELAQAFAEVADSAAIAPPPVTPEISVGVPSPIPLPPDSLPVDDSARLTKADLTEIETAIVDAALMMRLNDIHRAFMVTASKVFNTHLLSWAGRDKTLLEVEDRIRVLLTSEPFVLKTMPAIRLLRGGHIDYVKGGLGDLFIFATLEAVAQQGRALKATP